MTAPPPCPLVVAIANRKGGSGKTTTAVNLAVEWAMRGQRTVLIDLDTQGHAGLGVGLRRRPDPARTVHALFRDGPRARPETLARPTMVENLRLIPADPLFDYGTASRDPGVLRAFLRGPDAPECDWVILDTPPTRDVLLTGALIAAHAVVVPFMPQPLALLGIRQLARVFHDVATGYEQDLRTLALLPVMIDLRLRMHREIMDAVERMFGPGLLLEGIHGSVRLAEAFGLGVPIRRHAPGNRAVEDFRLLADALDGRLRGGRLQTGPDATTYLETPTPPLPHADGSDAPAS
ncbi:ParA family protein [Pararhodospirillum oryzae]|uniref:Cobyrinic acid a,c-diamide synthase n=1 Tax=Pararhodospirillum oryzae TaxID=478448 RepID=A0A512HC18_9PROT|nr:ParA family protein [Pararhodospirillum oryzae]GEO82998.1 cobyrinic acid a,c-diamide synthase [Pararhodospirillum oryzae]